MSLHAFNQYELCMSMIYTCTAVSAQVTFLGNPYE